MGEDCEWEGTESEGGLRVGTLSTSWETHLKICLIDANFIHKSWFEEM